MTREAEAGAPETEAPTPRSRKAEQSEATRAALVAAARRLFAERGYAGVGTEEIVRTAGVTRGALYHHFAGKEELFEAVYEEIEGELVQEIAGGAMTARDPVEALRGGAKAWLDACEDPAVQQIALLDAPSVLGWERWREIGMRYGFGLVEGTLKAAIEAGLIEEQPVRPLAHLVLGAIDEAAMVVARADDDGRTRAEVGEAVERFIDHLAPRP
jgi:AcrR family transcriptional regulator